MRQKKAQHKGNEEDFEFSVLRQLLTKLMRDGGCSYKFKFLLLYTYHPDDPHNTNAYRSDIIYYGYFRRALISASESANSQARAKFGKALAK